MCWLCAEKLSCYAEFVQQIEQNAENWDTFLESHKYVNIEQKVERTYDEELDDHPLEFQQIVVKGLDGIKIEICDDDDDDVPNTNTIDTYDVLELPSMKDNKRNTTSTVRKKRNRTHIPMWSIKWITEFERTCKLCTEPTFSSFGRLYRHQREMHPGAKWYSCDICGVEFGNKMGMYHHMKERHSNSGKTHQCQFCARLFYTDREMKSHEQTHLNSRSYVCSLCGKAFNTKSCLNVHLQSKQHNSNYKPPKTQMNRRQTQKSSGKIENCIFRCEICKPSIIFASRDDRTHHRNLVHKVHECEICKNSFHSQESLDCHKLLHSGKPRPHICLVSVSRIKQKSKTVSIKSIVFQVCNASFAQSSHLSSHIRSKHSDEKKFQCSLCNKSFVYNFALTAHINLVHSKKNRIKCNECESDFASPKYLQIHMLDKHSTEASPYDCKICGKRNLNAAGLNRHRRSHHKR